MEWDSWIKEKSNHIISLIEYVCTFSMIYFVIFLPGALKIKFARHKRIIFAKFWRNASL